MLACARMAISLLTLDDLPAATELLAEACLFDRAAEVAAEKLFGPSPAAAEPPHPMGLRLEDGRLAGVACVSGNRLRLLAVAPAHRGRGHGSALLAAAEDIVLHAGAAALHILDQPGNYLAPGLDQRNTETLTWLTRRGFVSAGAPRTNLLVALRGNPKVSAQRAAEVASAVAAHPAGYRLRRAGLGDAPALLPAIAAQFGGAWPFEVERALQLPEPGVHLAEQNGALCAFAAHDGNNQGLGWFGPAGTWPAHRGRRLGEALLLACLADLARTAATTAEIAWIGPEGFYESSCGITGRRIFLPLKKPLS